MAKASKKFASAAAKIKQSKKREEAAAPQTAAAARGAGPATGQTQKQLIGEILRDLGHLSDMQLEQLVDAHRMRSQSDPNAKIGQTAIALKLISPEALLAALAQQAGMQVVNLRDARIDKEAVELVDRNMAEMFKVMPISLVGRALTVAVCDPANHTAIDNLRSFLDVESIHPVAASEQDIMDAIALHYAGNQETLQEIIDSMEDDSDMARVGKGSIDLESMEEFVDAAPVRKLLNMVMLMAIRDKASDIHLEPFETEFRMRYKVDGVMYELVPPPRHLANAISSRVKVMANLDIAERRIPQDGRIELSIGGNPVDLRVNVLPTLFGEAVCMRVLDRSVISLDLNKIGMPPKVLESFRETIRRPHGIVLVTGPTGSGKTTTLYSALNELNDISVKIITSEDPIEYDIDGIVQCPVNSEIGVTFASILRAVLRQDPDIILIGEIRDFETAQIAIQSSLTGHLVFSTLHTNDAPGAITRLRDMGVQPFLITATVQSVLAQRLVRRICVDCREEFTPSPEVLMELNLRREQIQGRSFYQGRGCNTCNNTGHKGRTGIYEYLMVNEEVRSLIMEGAPKERITAAARRNGMMTLREAGLRSIFEGLTTVEEIVRETTVDEA